MKYFKICVIMIRVKNMKEINNDNKEKNNNEVKEYSFAKYICELRLKRNLTQKALADKIKVSDRTISKWENGLTVPDLHNIRSICTELGVSANSVVLEKNTLSDYIRNFFRFLSVLWKHIFNNIFKVIFAILFILLLIYFINNYNALSIYILNYDSDDITIGNGYFIKSKVRNILLIDNISLKDNPNYSSLDLELYTLVNGDKIVLYENDNMDDIFLEELSGYPDALYKDIIRAITKGLYLEITTYDDSNNKITYKSTINFTKNFSNNKLAYSNYQINKDYDNDYKRFLNIENDIEIANTTYHNFNSNVTLNLQDKINQNIEIENTLVENENNDKNKLKDLGYSYDETNNVYYKKDDNKNLKYYPEVHLLISKETVDELDCTMNYYIEKDRIDYYKYKDGNLNNPLIKFKYFVKQKELKCKTGDCKNYQSEIDYILVEYQAISSIL